MKKRVVLIIALLVMATTVFAAGQDKLGAYIGSPIGLSYSHEFNDLVELDLLASYNGWGGFGGLNVYLGALFTVLEGNVNGNPWAFTVGPSLGGTIAFWDDVYGNIDILADLRWEVDIPSVSGFNIFVDAAPGVSIMFNQAYPAFLGYRVGCGLRYRFK